MRAGTMKQETLKIQKMETGTESITNRVIRDRRERNAIVGESGYTDGKGNCHLLKALYVSGIYLHHWIILTTAPPSMIFSPPSEARRGWAPTRARSLSTEMLTQQLLLGTQHG